MVEQKERGIEKDREGRRKGGRKRERKDERREERRKIFLPEYHKHHNLQSREGGMGTLEQRRNVGRPFSEISKTITNLIQ